MNIGPLEIIIVIVVLLLLFGARRLPDLGKNLGGGIRDFGKAVTGDSDDEEEREKERRQLEAAAPKPPPAPEQPAPPAEQPTKKTPGAEG